MKTIFKVAVPCSGNGDRWWRSCYAWGEYALIYQLGEETKADKHTLGILVFRELESAKAFALGEGSAPINKLKEEFFDILECEFKGRLKFIDAVASLDRLSVFYGCLHYKVSPIDTIPAPLGTYACKSITPILKVGL